MATQIGQSGGITKSNLSSSDNTLAFPNLDYYRRPAAQQTNFFYPQSAQSAKESLGGKIAESNDVYQDFRQEQNFNNQYSLDAYKKSPDPSNNCDNQNSGNQNFAEFSQSNYIDPQMYLKREPEIETPRQAYRKALDQQVAERDALNLNSEKSRIKRELDSVQNYPFGRRNDNINDYNQVSGYQPSFATKPLEEPHLRLNKDNIIEKPNSLVADLPSYDPVKHRNGYHQGYNYDPWGKPGSGAPLIDSNGRKFTKYTGQVWYDTLGLTFDDRAKFYADKNRPLTLEEQKNEMEIEKQRKKMEEVNYKGRTGDLATWITDLENKRVNKIINYGAHLNHTNVTREKINLEYARKANINSSTKVYHDELGAQLEERNRMNKLYKLKNDVAGIEHTRKWEDWWGRPGGGAPNPDIRRRDLKETLESPRESKNLFEGNSLPVGPSHLNGSNDQYLYAKGTVRSNHKNHYDNVQPMRMNQIFIHSY